MVLKLKFFHFRSSEHFLTYPKKFNFFSKFLVQSFVQIFFFKSFSPHHKKVIENALQEIATLFVTAYQLQNFIRFQNFLTQHVQL